MTQFFIRANPFPSPSAQAAARLSCATVKTKSVLWRVRNLTTINTREARDDLA